MNMKQWVLIVLVFSWSLTSLGVPLITQLYLRRLAATKNIGFRGGKCPHLYYMNAKCHSHIHNPTECENNRFYPSTPFEHELLRSAAQMHMYVLLGVFSIPLSVYQSVKLTYLYLYTCT
jgi:hypothetical protein